MRPIKASSRPTFSCCKPVKGIDHLWVVMVQKDAIFIDLLQFVPLLTGILLAAVQFFPEMQRKCLKLTLHLPYSQKKMVLAMLAFGVLALFTCFAESNHVRLIFLVINIRLVLLTGFEPYR